MNSKWHILGAGAVGSLWGCHLSSSGFDVCLILRDADKLALFEKENVLSLQQDEQIHSFPASAELTTSPEPIHQLLITTKSIDTQEAVNAIRDRLVSTPRIIILQNGMGSQQWLSEQFPNAEIAWGSTTDGVWLKAPFKAVHAGKGVTYLGSPDQTFPWLSSLRNGLLAVEEDNKITETLWRKLAINCAINPLTAIYQCKNGELCRNPEYYAEMKKICTEVEKVIDALGLPLFNQPLIEQAAKVAELTGNNSSSMMLDAQHQRKTEIDSITGFLCKTAQKLGIKTPTNHKYWQLIKDGHPPLS